MFGKFTIKNSIRLACVGVITGFSAGCIAAVYSVFLQNHLTYKFYALTGYTFRKYMNKGIGTALLVCLTVACIVAAAHILSRFVFSLEHRHIRAKLLSIIFVCFAAAFWAAVNVHPNWRLSLAQHTSIFWKYNIGIMLGVCALGWVLMKLPLAKFLARIGRRCEFMSLLALFATGLVNGGVYLFEVYGVVERPNVILISIDDLRADHMGCYGYTRNTTPNMDVFARDNVLFTNAFVSEPWTLTSHMSMLTGCYTITHGVYDWKILDLKIPTLAEYLKNAGYATIAEVRTLWLRSEFGYGRGFDRYTVKLLEKLSSDPGFEAEKQNIRIMEALKKNKRQPFFAFIHYYDVHSKSVRLPYDAPSQFKSRFIADNASEFQFSFPGVYASDYLKKVNEKNISLDKAELAHIVDLYDSGIAYIDHCIGALFDFLKERDLYDNTIIIVTADHGEEFQEYGWMLHSNPYLYDVLMRVPLIVKVPNGIPVKEKTIGSLVESIDILPSILDFLNIRPIFRQGESFASLIAGEGAGKEYVYGFGSSGSIFIRSKKWKLMSDDQLNRNRYRLYNVENDPEERHDVVAEYPDIVEKLELKLRSRLRESFDLRARMINSGSEESIANGPQFRLDEAGKKQLRSLGYVL